MRAVAKVEPGVCGFDSVVTADVEDFTGNARVSIQTSCPNLAALGGSLEVGVMDIVQNGCGSDFFRRMVQVMPAMHCPCAVMNALIGAVKVAAGLALPKDIRIVFTKE